jgi:hypothetical protein
MVVLTFNPLPLQTIVLISCQEVKLVRGISEGRLVFSKILGVDCKISVMIDIRQSVNRGARAETAV